jgi:hypothetical protein
MTPITFLHKTAAETYTGQTAVICNFSENYSIKQDEVQNFLWNNDQATLVCSWLIIHKMK